jgi:class 3 adenylate cyclase/predicted ATPase/ABC-type lipoprotein export system ATPase subunit
MKCPKCQFENPEGMKFCGDCGARLEKTCPKCNSSNPPGFKFCGECGHNLTIPTEPTSKDLSFDEKIDKIQRYLPKGLTEKILAQRGKIEGERKQVTVMFCDMEGFTGLVEKLGPEEAYSIMDQVYEILIHKVHDYEGTVNEMTGDGVMALFGAPIALEDAPQRAIRSAYSIHREMGRYNEKLKQEKEGIPVLKMRVGIHTGPVVVGTLGNNLRVEFKAVGDTVNLASRMESLAEPGAIYITEDTFKLTEGLFRFESLGKKMVKGKREPIGTYRVIGPSSRRTRFDVSAERGLTPFVGRERELELLLDGFERAKAGRGQAFSIMGEAGVGKSRLLYEFRKAVSNEDATFLEGKCLSYSREAAYHPVIDVLKSNFDILEEDGDTEVSEKVERQLELLGTDKASTLPYLLELLSVKDSGIDKISLSQASKKDRIIEAVKRIAIKGSDIRPLVIAIEDLHWIDKSSEEYLKNLLENISGARVFLIFTYRPDFVHTWGGRSYHSQVNLNRLSNRESLAMVAHLLGTENIDRDLEELILEKTEGVPFFIEEFIRSLNDLKIIEKKDNRYQLTKDIQDLPIPSTIHDVIMARVDTLPEMGKEVLQIGSVIGREFSHDLIMKVTSLSEVDLLSSLSALKDSELLYERGIFPQSTYVFKHALTQDVVYDSILTRKTKQIHEEVGKAIENLYSEKLEDFYEVLAIHYTEAGLSEKAISYCQQAGKRASERSAYQEAISHLTIGFNLLQNLPETQERNQQELQMQTGIGAALLMVRGHAAPEVEAAYRRAHVLCQQLDDTQDILPVLFGLWRFYVMRADYVTARQIGEELLTLAKRNDDSALHVIPHYAVGFTCFCLGELLPARNQLEEGIAHYNPTQRNSPVFWAGQDPGVACRLYAALTLCLLGYADQALARAHDGLALANELAHPFSEAFALVLMSMVERLRRNMQRAYDHAEAAVALSAEQGFPSWLSAGTIFRGSALTALGQQKEGMNQLRQGLKDWRAIGTELFVPYLLTYLAEGYGGLKQMDEAFDALKEAWGAMERTGEHWSKAEIHRLKGELLLHQSTPDVTQAAECFGHALDVARNQQAKSLELRAANGLARLWQSQGKRQEAHDLLAPVHDWFTEGFETADLQEAKALLTELEN